MRTNTHTNTHKHRQTHTRTTNQQYETHALLHHAMPQRSIMALLAQNPRPDPSASPAPPTAHLPSAPSHTHTKPPTPLPLLGGQPSGAPGRPRPCIRNVWHACRSCTHSGDPRHPNGGPRPSDIPEALLFTCATYPQAKPSCPPHPLRKNQRLCSRLSS
jgi:hypothetical protein